MKDIEIVVLHDGVVVGKATIHQSGTRDGCPIAAWVYATTDEHPMGKHDLFASGMVDFEYSGDLDKIENIVRFVTNAIEDLIPTDMGEDSEDSEDSEG